MSQHGSACPSRLLRFNGEAWTCGPWKVRITKEIWVTLSDKAWWMHERCMTENDHSDFEDLIQHLGMILQLIETGMLLFWRKFCKPCMFRFVLLICAALRLRQTATPLKSTKPSKTSCQVFWFEGEAGRSQRRAPARVDAEDFAHNRQGLLRKCHSVATEKQMSFVLFEFES